MDLIVGALAGAGAAFAAGGLSEAGKELYAWMKRRVRGKLKTKMAKGALEDLEGSPDDEEIQTVLGMALTKAKAAEDKELRERIKELLPELMDMGFVSVTVQGKQIGSGALAQGPGATALGKGARQYDLRHATIYLTQPGTVSESASRPQGSRERYLNRVLSQARRVPLAGIDPCGVDERSRHDVHLDAVYTALMARGGEERTIRGPRPGQADAGDEPSATGPYHQKAVSALAMLDREPRLSLLGEPGSGKSTFVNYVAMCLAGEGVGDAKVNLKALNTTADKESKQKASKDKHTKEKDTGWTRGALLPVRVILRDFAAQELNDKSFKPGDALWGHIRNQLPRASEGFCEAMQEELTEKGGLLLLDGLDEVPDARKRRERLIQSVHGFAGLFPKVRILVTSRTYAYREENWKLDGFAPAVLAPFTDEQIAAFVQRWYAHIGPLRGMEEADAKGRAALLNRAIQRNKGLRDLAGRPLLLTLMASLHAWRDELPEQREELYASSVDLLLDQWQQKKLKRDENGEITESEPSLSEYLKSDKRALRRILNDLAFEAHRDQEGRTDTAADILQEKLLGRLLELDPKASQGLLIEYLRDRAGLLVPSGVSVYAFPHRSFQEYLAACHCTDQPGFPYDLAGLAVKDLNRWREVVLLAAAKTGRGAAAQVWSIVDALCPEGAAESTEEERERAARGALLAGQILLESGNLKEIGPHMPKLGRVSGRLARTVTDGLLSVVDRAQAGVTLAKIGDPRESVTTVDAMEFCWVPGGPFWTGDPEAAKDADNPLHRNETLPDDFWMARFPVSVAQFEEFVEDGGYASREWWLEEEAAEVWRAGKVHVFGEVRDRPAFFGEPYELTNHPAVGVSWYEALAFVRWLQARWNESGLLPEGWRVSLPSESEWEKAARGGERVPKAPLIRTVGQTAAGKGGTVDNTSPKRVYPWGEWDASRLNFGESGIGSTSSLGCFPAGASPGGCQEMSGNVREWTRSLWGKGHELERRYPYDRADGREDLRASGTRVLRGGAYWHDQSRCSCSYRFRLNPHYRLDHIGFRVVLSPSLDSDRL